MNRQEQRVETLSREIARLRAQLREAEDLARAIQLGEVDAFVVSEPGGEKVYTLKKAEPPWRLMIEGMREGAVTLAADGTILYCNRAFAELLGHNREALPGTSIHVLIAAPSQDFLKAILREARGGTGQGEILLQTSDGRQVPAYVTATTLPVADVTGFCLVVLDLSLQKSHEQIVAAETLSRSLLEQAAEAILVCDESGRIIRANKEAHRLCGMNPMLRPLEHVFPFRRGSFAALPQVDALQACPPGLPANLLEALRAGQQCQGVEVAFRRDDGVELILLLSAGSVTNPGGQLIGFVLTLTDITQRKAAERVLRQDRTELEARVAERTRELTAANEQLHETLEKLQVTEEELRQQNEELTQSRKGLEEEHRRYRELFDFAPNGYLVTDAVGTIQQANDGAGLLLCSPCENLVGRPLRMFIVPTERRAFLDLLTQLASKQRERVQDWEVTVKPRAGNPFPVAITVSVAEPAADQPAVLRWLLGDISERKRSDLELHKVNRALRALSRCNEAVIRIRDEIALLKEVCRVIVQEAGYRMCWVGYPQQDEAHSVLPMAHAGVEDDYLRSAAISWADNERGHGPTGSALRTGTAALCRDVATDPSMAPWREQALARGFRSTLSIPLSANGHPLGALTIYAAEVDAFSDEEVKLLQGLANDLAFGVTAQRDLVGRCQAEADLRALNETLEQRVRERTLQLEAANHELEAFAYSVSHDLRAPLRGIDGFSQALLEDCADQLDEQGKGHLQRVRAASQRMGRMIDALLQLSRLGRGEMQSTAVDLSSLAHEVAAELQRAEPGRKVTIVIPDGIRAAGDPRLLHVVLQNLLGNAWKFTGKKPEATIEFGITKKDGEAIYFVRDNGAGFDAEHADHLFGAFQRLHSEAEFPGSGIGLATVQRIIHRHGGRIWAEGAPERGATFFFTLASEGGQP